MTETTNPLPLVRWKVNDSGGYMRVISFGWATDGRPVAWVRTHEYVPEWMHPALPGEVAGQEPGLQVFYLTDLRVVG